MILVFYSHHCPQGDVIRNGVAIAVPSGRDEILPEPPGISTASGTNIYALQSHSSHRRQTIAVSGRSSRRRREHTNFLAHIPGLAKQRHIFFASTSVDKLREDMRLALSDVFSFQSQTFEFLDKRLDRALHDRHEFPTLYRVEATPCDYR